MGSCSGGNSSLCGLIEQQHIVVHSAAGVDDTLAVGRERKAEDAVTVELRDQLRLATVEWHAGQIADAIHANVVDEGLVVAAEHHDILDSRVERQLADDLAGIQRGENETLLIVLYRSAAEEAIGDGPAIVAERKEPDADFIGQRADEIAIAIEQIQT